MPNSILWIGLVVLWVFVLFPMLAGRHPRIRQHTDAALNTRVLHRGDIARRTRKGPATGHDTDPDYVPVRRKHHHDDPEDRMTRSDDSTRAESDDEDFDTDRERDTESADSARGEAVVSEPVATERADGDEAADRAEPETTGESESGTAESEIAEHAERIEREHAERIEHVERIEHDERIEHVGRTGRTERVGRTERTERVERVERVERTERVEPETTDASDTVPTPSVRNCSREDAPQRTRVPALRDEDESDMDDPDFVPSRRGRGGYDPEADAIARAARYTFRQRAVLGLVLSTLIFAGGALAISAALWWPAALAGTVLVGYLAYLRRQVQLEEDIRRRRTARLARSRREDAEAATAAEPEQPRPDREETRTQLRRAVLVEPDDEDPHFEHLELFDAATARAARERAAGRVRHAVGE
ncbi:divisome protein SepX/GlpR [Nocardia acidivorans]|uniref:divisome protein SepX/GlpR n=1 Tax=Nocardia acidivorans TaxID=404580 RepID=UPI00082DC675|nr:gephyrin-like molybdotransferase receptor GlpR [Nocardia acidivorans]